MIILALTGFILPSVSGSEPVVPCGYHDNNPQSEGMLNAVCQLDGTAGKCSCRRRILTESEMITEGERVKIIRDGNIIATGIFKEHRGLRGELCAVESVEKLPDTPNSPELPNLMELSRKSLLTANDEQKMEDAWERTNRGMNVLLLGFSPKNKHDMKMKEAIKKIFGHNVVVNVTTWASDNSNDKERTLDGSKIGVPISSPSGTKSGAERHFDMDYSQLPDDDRKTYEGHFDLIMTDVCSYLFSTNVKALTPKEVKARDDRYTRQFEVMNQLLKPGGHMTDGRKHTKQTAEAITNLLEREQYLTVVYPNPICAAHAGCAEGGWNGGEECQERAQKVKFLRKPGPEITIQSASNKTVGSLLNVKIVR